MNIKRNKWIVGLAVGVVATMLSGAVYAVDPGINQPGAVGNTGPARRSLRK